MNKNGARRRRGEVEEKVENAPKSRNREVIESEMRNLSKGSDASPAKSRQPAPSHPKSNMSANTSSSSSSKSKPEDFRYSAGDISTMSDDAFMDMLESADQETLKAHELMNPAIQQRLEKMLSREQEAIKEALKSQGKSMADLELDDSDAESGLSGIEEGDEEESPAGRKQVEAKIYEVDDAGKAVDTHDKDNEGDAEDDSSDSD